MCPIVTAQHTAGRQLPECKHHGPDTNLNKTGSSLARATRHTDWHGHTGTNISNYEPVGVRECADLAGSAPDTAPGQSSAGSRTNESLTADVRGGSLPHATHVPVHCPRERAGSVTSLKLKWTVSARRPAVPAQRASLQRRHQPKSTTETLPLRRQGLSHCTALQHPPQPPAQPPMARCCSWISSIAGTCRPLGAAQT